MPGALRRLGGNVGLFGCLAGSLWHAWRLSETITSSHTDDVEGLLRLAQEPTLLVAVLLLVVFVQWWHLLARPAQAEQRAVLRFSQEQPISHDSIARTPSDHSTWGAPLHSTPSAAAAAAAAAAARKPLYSVLPESDGKKLVMVVDGDPVAHMVLEGLLMPQGEFVICRAFSGQDAVQKLQDQPFVPDIMLLETLLPDVDGFSVCRCVREDYSRVELPVIMVSSHNVEEDVQRGLEAGANDFVAKPIRRLELLARIHTHLLLPQLVQAEAESYSNYALLQQMLPPRIIDTLKSGANLIAEQHPEVTILFSDIVGFTTMAAEMPTSFIVTLLNALFTRFDALCDTHGVYKVETIGDAYMIVCGHEEYRPDHALRMLAMASDMLEAVQTVSQVVDRDVRIRIGMHTGPAYSGVVGIKCPRYCFFGDTVNTASRMESHGFPMCIHYSQTTKDALERGYSWSVGSDFGCEGVEAPPQSVCCGERDVKGKGEMKTFLAQVGAWEQALSDLERGRSGASPLDALNLIAVTDRRTINSDQNSGGGAAAAATADAGTGYMHALMAPGQNGQPASPTVSSTNNIISDSGNSGSGMLPLLQHQEQVAQGTFSSDDATETALLAKLQVPRFADAFTSVARTNSLAPSAYAAFNRSDRKSNGGWLSSGPSGRPSLDAGSGQSSSTGASMQPGTPALSAFAAAAIDRTSTDVSSDARASGEAGAGLLVLPSFRSVEQQPSFFDRVHSDSMAAMPVSDISNAWQPQRSGSFTAPQESAAARRRNMQLQAYAGTAGNVRNGSPLSHARTPSGNGMPALGTLGNAILGPSKANYSGSGVSVSPRPHSGASSYAATTPKQRGHTHGVAGVKARVALRRSRTWDASAPTVPSAGTIAGDAAAAGAAGGDAGSEASHEGSVRDRICRNRSFYSDSEAVVASQPGAKHGQVDADDSSSLANHLPATNGWSPLTVQVPLTVRTSSPECGSAFAEHAAYAAAAVASGVHGSDTSDGGSRHGTPSPRVTDRGIWSKLHMTRAKSIGRAGSNGGSSSRCTTPRSPTKQGSGSKTVFNSSGKPAATNEAAPAASYWQLPWQKARPAPASNRASSGGGDGSGNGNGPSNRSSSGGGGAGVEGGRRSMDGVKRLQRLSEGGRLQQMAARRRSEASGSTASSSDGAASRSQRLSDSGKLQQLALEQLPDYMREQLDNGLGLPILIGSYGKEQHKRSSRASIDASRASMDAAYPRPAMNSSMGRASMDMAGYGGHASNMESRGSM